MNNDIARKTSGVSDHYAVRIENLAKRFAEVTAVDGLSFEIPTGEIFGLPVPNGSGRPTTINMISGLSSPTGGSVRIFGLDWAHLSRLIRSRLGSVPQETALFEELAAWTNLDFHADLYGMPKRDKRSRIEQMLELIHALAISLPVFFISGAFGPISFLTPDLQAIAYIFPVYYQIVVMQAAFHGFALNTLGLGVNLAVICGYAVLFTVLMTLAVRRARIAH